LYEKNRKVLIPIDVNKIKDTGDLFGTIAEEVSHGKDALEGRQDKKVAEAIQAIAKEKNIDVLVANPTSAGAVKEGNQVIDLTPDVVARINK